MPTLGPSGKTLGDPLKIGLSETKTDNGTILLMADVYERCICVNRSA